MSPRASIESARHPVAGRMRTWVLRAFVRACVWACAVERLWRPLPGHRERRILVLVFGGLGDSLLCDSLFRRLREHWPGARIDVVTAGFDAMWQRLESVDGVYFARLAGQTTLREYAEFIRRIYRARYDLCVEALAMMPLQKTLPLLPGVLLTASQAPIGIARPRRRGRPGGSGGGITHPIRPLAPGRRQAHETSTVLDALGIRYQRKANEPSLIRDPGGDNAAGAIVRGGWAAAHDLVVGVVLETTYELKRWPLDNFLELIRRGVNEGLKFVVLGLDTSHAKALSEVGSADSVLDLSGLTDLDLLMSVIQECDLFVGADSGPVHIAQAYGVPTIALFGPSNDAEFGPVDTRLHTLITPAQALSCRPCVMGPCVMDRSCMYLITVDQVHEALTRLAGTLRERPRRAEPIERERTEPLQVLGEL